MKRALTRILALLILALLPAALGGCSLFSLDHFTLHQANIVDFKLTEGATVRMTIENRSLFKVTVTGGELTAYPPQVRHPQFNQYRIVGKDGHYLTGKEEQHQCNNRGQRQADVKDNT